MSDDTLSYSSGSSEAIKFGKLNRSPVLYLRRSRVNDFPRPFEMSDRENDGSFAWDEHPPHVRDTIRPDLGRGKGRRYPNHCSKSRMGAIEWQNFRVYKKRLSLKWIRMRELVID